MPEVIFNGVAGRLEGHYCQGHNKNAPMAIIMHAHPLFGGHMDNAITYSMYHLFREKGFSVLRFNFRGIGRSQGSFDHGPGELADAAAALNWAQQLNDRHNGCWVVGYSFGAWIAMQLLMRRPEIEGFMAISPQPRLYDFSFLAPCPASGFIACGSEDSVAKAVYVKDLIQTLENQSGIVISSKIIEGADHFYTQHMQQLLNGCGDYITKRLNGELASKKQKTFKLTNKLADKLAEVKDSDEL